jgi:hypothetical protein
LKIERGVRRVQCGFAALFFVSLSEAKLLMKRCLCSLFSLLLFLDVEMMLEYGTWNMEHGRRLLEDAYLTSTLFFQGLLEAKL